MPAKKLTTYDWEVVPGEEETLTLRWWLDDHETDPDTTISGDTFQFTARNNPRDSGVPLVYLESGAGITSAASNEITITLTAEQTAVIGGCKAPVYGLAREGTSILVGDLTPIYAVVQGSL